MEIKGKTVLVTGASSGVGAAIAKEMALAGAGELLLLARNENELKKVAAAIASLGAKSRIYPVDLSNPDQVTAIVQRIEREATIPDIIVNNAGYSGQWKFLDETTPKEIQDMMAVPYFAAAWLTNQCPLLGVKRIPSTMVKTSNQRDNHDRYLGVRYSSMMCLPR
jgi:short-subunit dehydrogenase